MVPDGQGRKKEAPEELEEQEGCGCVGGLCAGARSHGARVQVGKEGVGGRGLPSWTKSGGAQCPVRPRVGKRCGTQACVSGVGRSVDFEAGALDRGRWPWGL